MNNNEVSTKLYSLIKEVLSKGSSVKSLEDYTFEVINSDGYDLLDNNLKSIIYKIDMNNIESLNSKDLKDMSDYIEVNYIEKVN